MTQHIQLNRKEGYIGATQKSLEQFRDGLIFEDELVPLKNITGYSITFIKGGYPSFPILFYFHTSQNLTEKDSELAQILTEVLQNFNINIKYYITDRD